MDTAYAPPPGWDRNHRQHIDVGGTGRRGMEIEHGEWILAGGHAGVLSVVVSSERAPLAAPVWYGYHPGDVIKLTAEPDRRMLEAVRKAERATLTVRNAGAFVAVEAAVVVFEPTDPEEYLRWAVWNLGAEAGERYVRAAADDLEEMTTVRLLPCTWRWRALTPALGACRG